MDTQLYKLDEAKEGFFRDRGSKFYAFAFPVKNLEQVAHHLSQLKRRFHDARHHCYAYRLGSAGETTFASDDREPANSAGPPILAAIRSQQLTQTSVVVVRYFGGTKLGIRGLIAAYRSASEEALTDAPRTEIIATRMLQLEYEYPQTSMINKLLHQHGLVPIQAQYTDRCNVIIEVPEQGYASVRDSFTQAGFPLHEIPSNPAT